MPELGQNRSPGALLPRGQHGPPRGPGPAWVMGAQWEPARGLLCLQRLASGPPRGDADLGHFGLGHIIMDGTSRLLARSTHGAERRGERRHLGLHPVNPFAGVAGSFPGCPCCPWGGAVPAAGLCYCRRAPLEDQCSPARPHSTAQEFPSRPGLGRPVCFRHDPKAQWCSTQIFIWLVENKIKQKKNY